MNIYFTKTNTREELTAYIFSIPSAREKAIADFKKSGAPKCFQYINRHRIGEPLRKHKKEFNLFGLTFKEVE